MVTSAELRTISLWERGEDVALWFVSSGHDPEDLMLSEWLCARLREWQDDICAAADEALDEETASYLKVSPKLRWEGTVLAQTIADEMGQGVTVRFYSDTFFSMSPPTNPAARIVLENEVKSWERHYRINPKGFRWVAELPVRDDGDA
jgi:hypothetical protein